MTSIDELARMLSQVQASASEALVQPIWAFNEYQAGRDDTFDADDVTARLADVAEVLIPAS